MAIICLITTLDKQENLKNAEKEALKIGTSFFMSFIIC
jgi:hypothetical protein